MIMNPRYFWVLAFAAALLWTGHLASAEDAGLPKDPQAVLAMAAPYYDYSNASLKPWRLKAAYQLYDANGKPTEQGTFEYWWASPKVYRASWTRPGASLTDWHTADGKRLSVSSGAGLNYFEREIEELLFSPLPSKAELDPEKTQLKFEERRTGGLKIPCVLLLPVNPGQEASPAHTAYCFDPKLPVLIADATSSTVETIFQNVGMVQQLYLARKIETFVDDRSVFSLTVQSATGLSAADPALIPPANAKVDVEIPLAPKGTPKMLSKTMPDYPPGAKELREQGTVLLEGTIAKDGSVHDLEVDSGPSELLDWAARRAVSTWKYEPYLVNGKPVEVHTTIFVIFTLSR